MGDGAPDRISRKITSNGPVQDVTSIDLQCGGISSEGIIGSEPAPLHATAEAGSTVNLKWTLWPDSHMGPILTYMARCPDEGCDKWLPGEEYVELFRCPVLRVVFQGKGYCNYTDHNCLAPKLGPSSSRSTTTAATPPTRLGQMIFGPS